MCSTPATRATTPPPGATMLKNSVSPNSFLPFTTLKFPPNQDAPASVKIELPSVSVTPMPQAQQQQQPQGR